MSRTRAARRRIAVVTGTRAEYGLLCGVMRAIEAHPRLELQVVAAGMHLLPRFGATVREIERDGWRIAARVPMQRGDDSPQDQALGIARGVAGVTRFLVQGGAEIVVVLGDRIEAFAAAAAAVTCGRVLAHIHGGDVAPGDFDDSLRHAISKLAHLHFAATPAAARRLRRMGEAPWRIHTVGAPGLDRLRELLAERPARRRGENEEPPFALVVQHPCGRPQRVEQRVAEVILGAARDAGLRRVIIYPNSDRGCAGVVRAIEAHARRSPTGEVELRRSLPRNEFLRRLIRARVLIGNSSAGIIEAPFAGTPSIDVGQRQAGRERGGPSVIRCEESPGAIRAALRRVLRRAPRGCGGPRRGACSVYGNTPACDRIARVLATIEINPRLLRKRIAY
ncbi:MAG: UDP-N-acetylglucosamine 2-epimerase (hydrolyzing) [Phycisphaerae bacterium]|jgi:UDP-hydrolysing UDP-N-acetyl-D-glucosamine 2-epimerase